jgi:hypothetical protein
VLLLRHDANVEGGVLERLRGPLEEAAQARRGLYEAYVYKVGNRRGELMLRISSMHGVVPILLRTEDLEHGHVVALVKDALLRADA